jgi:hypothetical protein
MAGTLLTEANPAQCVHGGTARPTLAGPRVRAGGAAVAAMGDAWIVTGCPAPVPCVTAQFVEGASRVRSVGRPVLLQSSPAVCAPSGTPLILGGGQGRVLGS